jgi:hypothetical protein
LRVNPWRGLTGLPRALWVLAGATLVTARASRTARLLVSAALSARIREPRPEAA